MKKVIALVLSAVMCLGLFAGCGSSGNSDVTKETSTTPTTHAETTPQNRKLLHEKGRPFQTS